MNFEGMTIKQLTDYLDEHQVDHSDAKLKADFVALAEEAQAEADKPSDVADLVKSAIKIEKETTKVEADPLAYLKDRDYSQLSVGERAIIREQSPEYENVDGGVSVTVTDRLVSNHRIIKRASGDFAKLVKGVTYMLSQEDYDALKDDTVRVKTLATKNKCCGQARYEPVNLIEVAND